jgi:hypothetical protein
VIPEIERVIGATARCNESILLDVAFVFGWIGFEFLFAVVAAESHFLTFVGHRDVRARWTGSHRAGFIDGSSGGKAGKCGEGEGKEKLFHVSGCNDMSSGYNAVRLAAENDVIIQTWFASQIFENFQFKGVFWSRWE